MQKYIAGTQVERQRLVDLLNSQLEMARQLASSDANLDDTTLVESMDYAQAAIKDWINFNEKKRKQEGDGRVMSLVDIMKDSDSIAQLQGSDLLKDEKTLREKTKADVEGDDCNRVQ